MADNFVILPDDTSNTGKLVRTQTRTVGGSTVHEHYMILQDEASDNQATIDSSGFLHVAGSISSLPQVSVNAGSVEVYQTDQTKLFATISGNIIIGSVSANVDSVYIQSGANLLGSVGITNINNPQTLGSFTAAKSVLLGSTTLHGIGSVQLVPGSLEVYQSTNSNLQVQATQETSPWIILGSVNVDNQISEISVGSESYLFGQSGTQWMPIGVESGTNSVLRTTTTGSIAVSNFNALGSNITGSVAITTSVLPVSGIVNLGTQADNITTLLGSTSVYNRVAGSIVNLPSIDVNNPATIGSYTTQNVTQTGSLEVFTSTGSVNIYGNLSATNPSVSKPGTVGLGSFTMVAGFSGGVAMPLRTTAGSELIILGSVHQVNSTPATLTGSIEVFSVTGSVQTYGTSVSTGSNVWVKGGSISVYDGSIYIRSGTHYVDIATSPVPVSGIVNLGTQAGNITTLLGSTSIYAGSITLKSGTYFVDIANRVGGSIVNWPGSLAISNFAALGSTVTVAGGSIALINSLGSVQTFGSVAITSPINVTTGSEVYVKGGSIQTYNPIGVGSVTGQVTIGAGSIQTYNPVGVGSVTGVITVRAGSIQPYNPIGVGSVTGVITVRAGSIQTYGNLGSYNVVLYGSSGTNIGLYPLAVQSGTTGILQTTASVTTGSEVYVKAGSIQTYNPIGVGSVTGKVEIGAGSITVYNRVAGSIVNLPGVDINNPATIGSYTTQGVSHTGSLEVFSSTGSVNIYGNISASNPSVAKPGTAGTGSMTVMAGWSGGVAYPLMSTTGSVLMTQPQPGSVYVLTSPGSIGAYITNTIGIGSVLMLATDSSNNLDSPLVAAGSYLMVAGSISSMPSVTATNESVAKPATAGLGSFTMIAGFSGGVAMPLRTDAGSTLITSPVVGIGSVRIAEVGVDLGSVAVANFAALGSNITGSVAIVTTVLPVSGTAFGAITGSVNVNNKVQVENTRGVFFSSGGTVHTSGTVTVIHTPGTGSKVLLKGFTVSAELATQFRLFFSGGTDTRIGTWMLPNSGTIAMNLLGMEPSGAVNQPVSVGLFNNGSIHITLFGGDTL